VNFSRVLAILVKDLTDAMRDGRIIILLVLPIGLAVFWNATASDPDERPESTVAVVDEGRIGLAAALREAAADSVELETIAAADERAARRMVDAEDAASAVLAPAPVEGEPARARILLPENATPTAQSVVALVPAALGAAAGRPPSTEVSVQPLPTPASDQRAIDVLDTGTSFIVVGIVTLVTFVALLVVPMQTAEEIGTGTFGALRLAATGPEILAAKALSGLLFALLGTALTLLITQTAPDDAIPFYLAGLGLTVSLVGFGLLLGLASGNANQINTYGGFLIMPVLVIVFATLIVDSGPLLVLLDVLPFSQGARLMFDAVGPEDPFGAGLVAWLVLAAWCVVGFAVLTRVVVRREA